MAYFEDIETTNKKNNTNIYVYVRAAGESSLDFSSRWMVDEKDLSTTVMTVNIFPVILNFSLYRLELTLNKQNEAERRRQAIHKYIQSSDLKHFQ